jgi:hypothetical protein
VVIFLMATQGASGAGSAIHEGVHVNGDVIDRGTI